VLAELAASRSAWSPQMSLLHLKLRVSEGYNSVKAAWNPTRKNWGSQEIPSPPPKKSCADRARNSVARVAAQIRTGRWQSAVFLHRIRRCANDLCRFCNDRRR